MCGLVGGEAVLEDNRVYGDVMREFSQHESQPNKTLCK